MFWIVAAVAPVGVFYHGHMSYLAPEWPAASGMAGAVTM